MAKDNIRDCWAGLGIAFATATPVKNADPEKTLIESLPELEKDRKLLALILSWFAEYGFVFHVERIKSLASDLSARELAWLGGIADYQVYGFHDQRWNTVKTFVEKKISGAKFSTSKLDELQAKKNGKELAFFNFGLLIPKIDHALTKKIAPRANVIKKNIWLRYRLLFGTNWRADMAAVMIQKLAKNSYQAEKILGCSRETAYRNWNALKAANAEEILA